MRWCSRSNVTAEAARPDLMDRAAACPVYDCTVGDRVSFSAIETGDIADAPFHDFLIYVSRLLSHSPVGLDLFHQASDQDYGVSLWPGEEMAVDQDTRTLMLPDHDLDVITLMRSSFFRADLTRKFLKGLRQIDQIERGCIIPVHRPDQSVLYARARAADIEAVAIHIAHDVRGEDMSLWRHVLSSETGDLATLYAAACTGIVADALAALSATFLAWYGDQVRMNVCDHDALEDLDVRLAAGAATGVMKARVTLEQYRLLCVAPLGAETYLTPAAFRALKSAGMQMLYDETNAAHLHHVLCDVQTLVINNVAFRDKKLARRIFPDCTE